jgi:flagellar hook-associated protein 1
MSTIFSSLTRAQQSLQVQQYGLEIAQKNIANVNTPGYSRQRLNVMPGDSIDTGISAAASWVQGGSIESFRNRFLEYRIGQETEKQGYFDAKATALGQIESLVSADSRNGLDASISDFFDSFSSLANAPEDVTLREQVLASGTNLASRFNQIYEQIQSVQRYQEYYISDTTSEINALTSAIAGLNGRAAQAIALNAPEASELQDQRQVLLEKLSGFIDVSYFETESGEISVVTRQGGPLVLAQDSFALKTARSGMNGQLQIELQGANITSSIQGGKLGGLLAVRDEIGGYLNQLDDLAAGLISRVNTQHRAGVDYNGEAGGDFFTPFVQPSPGSNAGAARGMTLAISDANDIAAATSGSGVGSNGNAVLIAGIADEDLFGGGTATATEHYANMVFDIGKSVRAAESGSDLEKALLVQLNNQRDASSGVSLDEEAVSIVKYQKAFEATARYISLLNQLTDDLIKMLG